MSCRAHLFRRRYWGLIASLAFVGLLAASLLLGALWKRRAVTSRAAEAEESLLYSHIPGTPARGPAGALHSSSAVPHRLNGPVAKKLSNLPA